MSGDGKRAGGDVIASQFPYCQRLGHASCRVGFSELSKRPEKQPFPALLGLGPPSMKLNVDLPISPGHIGPFFSALT